MKIGFILGSIVGAQPSSGIALGQATKSATSFERQIFSDARALENTGNPYGETSSPIYFSQSVSSRYSFYWLFRHGVGERPIPPHCINYRANIYALARAGIKTIFALNAFGSLDDNSPPGTHVIPDQLIDYTWGRQQTFFDGSEVPDDVFPDIHADFTMPLDSRLRSAWISLFTEAGIAVRDGGVCAVTQGPRLESKAEILRLGTDGAHYVNMTLCPEAVLARELKMDYLCSGFISNWAAGMHGSTSIDSSQCERFARAGLTQLAQLIDMLRLEPSDFETDIS